MKISKKAIVAVVIIGIILVKFISCASITSGITALGVVSHPGMFSKNYIVSVEHVVSTNNLNGNYGNPGDSFVSTKVLGYEPPVTGMSYLQVNCQVSKLYSQNNYPNLKLYVYKESMGVLWGPYTTLSSKLAVDDYCDSNGSILEFTGVMPSSMKEDHYVFVIKDGLTVDSVFEYRVVSSTNESSPVSEMVSVDKPVIYMYPEENTEAFVSLDYNGELTCTYPSYNDDYGWHVMAHPGGVITDLEGGRDYDYLYWEGVTDESFSFDQAVCVRGCDTAAFLEEYLEASGLTYSEIDDFITYWLPKMECNEYNLISFPISEYEEIAELNVEPEPDTVIRVYMVFTPLDEEVYIPEEQQLQMPTPVERTGFTVVEWGGSEV